MKLPAYPRYKPSGIEWLGDVPEHWEKKKVTYGFSRIGSGTTPKSDSDDFYDGDVPWVTTSELRENVITKTKESVTRSALAAHSALRLYPSGTLLFAMYGATIGRLGILGIPATLNQACCAFAEPRRFDTRFVFYWLWMRRPILISLSIGGGQPNLSQDDLRQIRILTPPLAEQRCIAEFLDRETGRVDRLVSKKRELIERLKEKRTALISRTVTRGLPSEAAAKAGLRVNPPLKPSGLDWLGDIPEHWELVELRRFTQFITSGSRGWAEHYSDEGAIFVRIGNLTRNSINVDLSDVQHVDPPPGAEGERTRIRQGDILFSITAYLGSVAVATRPILGAYINQHIALLRVAKNRVNPRFVAYSVLGDAGQLQLRGLGYGGTKIQLSLDDVKSLRLCVPSLSEQTAIVAYLDTETTKLDALIAKVETAIERLQEYRTALITAAVTGKIDVRSMHR